MIVKSFNHGIVRVTSAPAEVKEPKIPQPIVEEVEEELENPDDGEGEG